MLLSTKHIQLKTASGKLKPRFIGPFKVLALVGNNVAKLELLSTMRVHPVFNVALLKLYKGKLTRPGPIKLEGQEEYEIAKILHHRRSRGRL